MQTTTTTQQHKSFGSVIRRLSAIRDMMNANQECYRSSRDDGYLCGCFYVGNIHKIHKAEARRVKAEENLRNTVKEVGESNFSKIIAEAFKNSKYWGEYNANALRIII